MWLGKGNSKKNQNYAKLAQKPNRLMKYQIWLIKMGTDGALLVMQIEFLEIKKQLLFY